MTVQDERATAVADLWCRAGSGQAPWTEALSATSGLLRGAGCCTFELDRARGGFGDFHLVGLEPGAGDYVARMNSINPRMRYSLDQPGPHVVTDHAILPERELRRHEFYDWMTRTKGTRYFVGARVLDRDRRSVFASVEYSPRQGHPDAETVAMFTRLVPHIENAWRLSALRRDLDAARQLTSSPIPNGARSQAWACCAPWDCRKPRRGSRASWRLATPLPKPRMRSACPTTPRAGAPAGGRLNRYVKISGSR